MAVIISNTCLYSSSTLPSSSSPSLLPYHSVKCNYYRWYNRTKCSHRYTGLFTCNASSKAGDSNHDAAEEARWFREEQRWLREEQRWLREEARWNAERQSLLLEIQRLKAELDRRVGGRNNSPNFDIDFVIDDDSSASQTLVKMAALLKGLVSESESESKSGGVSGDSKRIAAVSDESELITPPPPRFDRPVSASTVKPPPEIESNEEDKVVKVTKEKKKENVKTKITSSLRMGAEGDDEALMNLGFYSGEEDMEFSSFSDGTSRAVKTWQASVGIREDGVMTPELLEILYASQEVQSSELSFIADVQKMDEANGAVAEIREVQQTVVEKEPVDLNKHRVFLLGENRWEEPSRLIKTVGKTPVSGTRCLTCKGEGRLLCMECDGTGEPNVEEQFLDWVGEAPTCPYCEGLGYNVCDVCQGKPVL